MTTKLKIADNAQKKTTFGIYQVYYDNQEAVEQTITEVTNDSFYKFISKSDDPFIIDAGSNIGISALFFKSLYPQANILCIEPDPIAFLTLKKNIAINHLQNVNFLNGAITKEEGKCNFFGQITVPSPDARGNSIIRAWGIQRPITNIIEVKAIRLSSYITRQVDFLKLDIEGAEQQVLEELIASDKLSFIKELTLEVHQIEAIKLVNDLDVILDLLKQNQFKTSVVEKKIPSLWPLPTRQWAKKNEPRLFSVNAIRLQT